MFKNYILFPLIAFCLLFMTWEACSRFFIEMAFVLPPPSRILLNIWEKSDRFWFHAQLTLLEMLGGMALAFSVAFPLAWMMVLSVSARLILQPLFIIIQCVPMFALAPIMVIWFGWSYTAIVVPTALMVFFPLTMNIYQGLCSAPRHLVDYFKFNQATKWQVFYKLQLPWALPYIFVGFRISAAIAGVGAIAGEWAGAQAGLGLLMLESRRGADLETTFGALFCLTFLSVSLYCQIMLLEKIFICLRFRASSLFSRAPCLTGFIGLSFLLVGCQSDLFKSEQKTRLILDWLPNPNHVPLFVGVEKGFFKQCGIDLEIKKIYDASSALPYLTSNQVELAVYYTPSSLRAIARGASVESIAVLVKKPLSALIFRKGEGIRQLSDLNDKVIGYCVDGWSTTFLDALLEGRQIKPAKKYNVSFDMVCMLATHRVDVLYGGYWNIECAHLASLGIETDYFELMEFGVPCYHELVVIGRSNSLQTNPEFVSKFQKALQKSIDFSVQNPDEAFEIYLKANPDKGDKTRQWEKDSWLKTMALLAKDQEGNVDAWKNFSDWLRNQKLL